MNATTAAQAADIVAALLFVLSLAGLSQHHTARAGVAYGVAGMALALSPPSSSPGAPSPAGRSR